MAAWAGPLAVLPPGTPTAFLWNPHPPAVALDLAIQAAGLVSVPVTDSARARERGARAWAGPAGTAGPEGLEHVSLPSWDREAKLPERPAGGVMVERVVTQEELVAAAERLRQAIGGGGREIVVAGRAPERWLDRALFAWATLAGAAVLLAPDPSSLIGSAVWARPTVFFGSAAELKALRQAVEQEKPPFWDRKASRLPFARLRVVLSDEPVEEDFWEGRGVRVERT